MPEEPEDNLEQPQPTGHDMSQARGNIQQNNKLLDISESF